MLTNVDVAVCVTVVCAVAAAAFKNGWSLGYITGEIQVCVLPLVAYWVLSHFRQNATVVKQKSAQIKDFEDSQELELMKKYSFQGNINAAMCSFRAMQLRGQCLSSFMYNTVLQAFVNSGNVQGAEDWLEEMKLEGMADELSFNILIKALVTAHAMERAMELLGEMKTAGLKPSAAEFNEVLGGFARESRFKEADSLLEEMQTQSVEPTSGTRNTIVKLMNASRDTNLRTSRVRKLLHRYNLEKKNLGKETHGSDSPVPVPGLAGVISRSNGATSTHASCSHEIHVTGSLSHIKSVRKTFKQLGFLDKAEGDSWPLDGHWETDYGLTVVIEGKVVRWSGQKASRLKFSGKDRRACVLRLYGVETHGHLVSPAQALDATKTIVWDNGDVWNSYEGRVIGQDALYSQSMTKTLHDQTQDQMYCARASAVLKSVSKQALGVPSILEKTIVQCLGSGLYYFRVLFESRGSSSTLDEDELPSTDVPNADICDSISRRHPLVGLRHCWADRVANSCGQRTVVNGEEVDEDCFSRHVNLVSWK